MTGQWRVEDPGTDPPWVDDDDLFDAGERSTSYPPDNLVTLRFLWNAVRRHTRLWLAIAVAGLAGGLAFPVVLAPASVSSAKVLLTHRDGDDPARAMATDVSLVKSHTVAQRAIDRLKLTETPDQLLKRYTATPLTDRVLEIAVSAKTTDEATKLAGTLATIYLTFRKEQIALQEVPLRKDLAAARTAVTVAVADVKAAGGDPTDPDPKTTPETTRLARARDRLRYIEQQVIDQQVAASRMSSSRVLDAAAPVPHSPLKSMVINTGMGIALGLFLGVGFVVIRALVSERLWKRQDIARALGAPIRLSVGKPPRHWWRPFPQYLRRSQMRKPEIRLVVRYLRRTLSADEDPKSELSIVSVDTVRESAMIVAALAMSLAEEGKRVLAADLSGGTALAAALGVTKPGTHDSRFENITVHVPSAEAGPAELGSGDDEGLDSAWTDADVVLTLATLSPALGGEHLRTWSSRATIVLMAGRTSATKIHAAGELIRLAGVQLVPAVLLRADRSDDSVGAVPGEPAGTVGR